MKKLVTLLFIAQSLFLVESANALKVSKSINKVVQQKVASNAAKKATAKKTITKPKVGPHKLPDSEANKFYKQRYTSSKVTKPMILYRYHVSGNNVSHGNYTYLTREKLSSQEAVHNHLAIKRTWTDKFTYVDTYHLNPTHKVVYHEGLAAPLKKKIALGIFKSYKGGGNQIAIDSKDLMKIKPIKKNERFREFAH